MLGYEIEVDLAVTDEDGNSFDGEVEIANSTTAPGFKLVTDSRSLDDDGGDYSNIEFVTNAVSVIGNQHVGGRATVLNQLAEVLRIRNALYHAGSGQLAGVDGTLATTVAGGTALLAPELEYTETNRLLVHYSVGLPLAGMPDFFTRLRAAAPVPVHIQGANSALSRDRFSLRQAHAFAAAEIQRFLVFPHAPGANSAETRGLNGYLQLAYTQICALADNLEYANDDNMDEDDIPLIKNTTAVLCRSYLADVFPLLGDTARQFLAARCATPGGTNLVSILSNFQETPEPGHVGNYRFFDDGQSAHQPTITLRNFARAAFIGNLRVDPISVFGDMSVIAPHPEQGATMVPLEIRTINNEAKTWNEVQNELTNLCTWAQDALQLA